MKMWSIKDKIGILIICLISFQAFGTNNNTINISNDTIPDKPQLEAACNQGVLGFTLTGETSVCLCTEYRYFFIPDIGGGGAYAGYTIEDMDWTYTVDGGTIIRSLNSGYWQGNYAGYADVEWDGNGTIEAEVTIKFAECSNAMTWPCGSVWVMKKTNPSPDVIDVRNLNNQPPTFLCAENSYRFFITGFSTGTTCDRDYRWTFSSNGGTTYRTTTNYYSTNFRIPDDYRGTLTVSVSAGFRDCDIDRETQTNYFTIRPNLCNTINVTTDQTTCFGRRDGEIQINDLPNSDSLYYIGLYRYVLGSGGPMPPLSHLCNTIEDGYEFSGYAINFNDLAGNIGSLTLDSSNVELELAGQPSLFGLRAGYYLVDIENGEMCPVKNFINIPEPDQMIISSVNPLGNYPTSDNNTIYHIKDYGGTDEININFSGGNSESDYTYYVDVDPITGYSDFNGTTSNTNFDVPGIPYNTTSIKVVDYKGCTSNSFDVALKQPRFFELVDIPEEFSPTCNATNSGVSTDGSIAFDVAGGIYDYYAEVYSYPKTIGAPILGSDQSTDTILSVGGLEADKEYVLQVYDEHGTYLTSDYRFTIDAKSELVLDTSTVHPVCFGYSNPTFDGEITLTASGGNGGYTYSLLDQGGFNVSGNDGVFSSIRSGESYFASVIDNLDCELTMPVTIPVNGYRNPLSITLGNPTSEVCLGGADGQIELIGTGGHDLDYSSDRYSFVNPFLTYKDEDFQDLNPTTVILDGMYSDSLYNVQIQDSSGCVTTQTISITGYSSPLSMSFQPLTQEVCLGGSDGSIEIETTGGHQGSDYDATYYSFPIGYNQKSNENIYTKNGTGITVVLDGIFSDTTYLVQFNDKDGCEDEISVSVSGYSNPLGFNKGIRIPPNCIGGNDGYFEVQGFGGHSEPYGSSYYDLEFYTDAYYQTNSPIVRVDSLYGDSTYTLTIDDGDGCVVTDTISLHEEPFPVAPLQLDSAEEKCYDYKDGWIRVSAQLGEQLGYGYDYYLTEEDMFSMNPLDPIDTSIVKSGTDATFYNIPPGWHSVYVADENNCLDENIIANRNVYKTDFYVDKQDSLQYSFEKHNSSTIGGSDGYMRITISGGNDRYEYIIFDKTDMSQVESGTITIGTSDLGSLREGEYQLQFRDTCGCTNSGLSWLNYDFVILDPADSLRMDIVQINQPSCFNGSDGSIVVSGRDGWGDFEYGIDSVYNGNVDGILPGFTSGGYNVCVRDKEGAQYCDSVFIDQPDSLMVFIDDISDAQCHAASDGTIEISATGGTLPYFFSKDGTNWSEDSVLTGFNAGIHTLYVQDTNTCITPIDATVAQPDPWSVTYEVTDTRCSETNGSITVHASGGTKPYQFAWYDEGTSIGNDSIVSNLHGGMYEVIISDFYTCDTTFNVLVTNSDGPQIDILHIDSVSCNGLSDGSIEYSIQAGSAPYSADLYLGSSIIASENLATSGTSQFNDLGTNQYQIIVSDINNCFQSYTDILIEQPETMNVNLDTLVDPVCYNYSDGMIDVSIDGGNGNFQYDWDNGDSGQRITNLPSGNYTVTITDSKGCNIIETYTLINPEELTVTLDEDATICPGQTYPLSATGYTTYSWVFGGETISTDPEIMIWEEGEYSLEVTDEKGCLANDDFTLSVSDDLLEAEFLMPSEAYENDTVVIIDISWPEPENIVWSFSPGIISISSEPYIEELAFTGPGTHTITLTSFMAQCADSITKEILVHSDTTDFEKTIQDDPDSWIKTFKVYPNPNNGQFLVEVELIDEAPIIVDLFSMQTSNTVFRHQATGQAVYTIEYGFTRLSQGVYLVILYVKDEKKVERILIF